MKEAFLLPVFVVAVVVAAIAYWATLRARARVPGIVPTEQPKVNPADAGRELRAMMLTMSPKKMGVVPTKEFPRVFGLLMDWPITRNTATVFSASDGNASLYTTSTFGVIGGIGHDSVRAAAKAFVRAADRYVDAAAPTTDYPYPAADRVRFYFLTFNGVRFIDTDLASMNTRTSKYLELFALGQAVLTELRLVTEKDK
jgi:hypothetical protein